MTKKSKWIILSVCMVIIAAAGVIWGISRQADEGILFYVDGEPVYMEEVEFVINKERLTVRNHIMTEYGVEEDEFSWEAEFGGKKASKYMEEKIFEECARNKMIQITARDFGVADKIDYPSVKKMNDEDSRVREDRIGDGEVIYGNTAYRPEDYFDYMLSNLEQQSYYKMVEDGTLEMTESEIDKLYEEHREALIEAGTDDRSIAETIGLQQKYADYIQQRAGEAKIKQIDKEGMYSLLKEL